MRKYICGDLHGMYDLFEEKLIEINFNKETDIMYSVGDLIDRGPKSMECLRLLKQPYFKCVRGNHEDFLIQTILYYTNPNLWMQNGGSWFLDEDLDELKELAALAEQLPYAITINNTIGICHAEPPTLDWNDAMLPTEYHKQKMIWGRHKITQNLVTKNIKTTYHGHTIVDDIIYAGNAVFIDTGAYYYKKLTIVEITND